MQDCAENVGALMMFLIKSETLKFYVNFICTTFGANKKQDVPRRLQSNRKGLIQPFRKQRHKKLALSPGERHIPPKETIITDFRPWKMD